MRKSQEYIIHLIQLLLQTEEIEGDIIEVGCFDGDTSEIICGVLQDNNIDKRYFGIDTFKGYVKEDLIDANQASINNQKRGRWNTSKEIVEERLSQYTTTSNIYEGDSKVVVPSLIDNGTIDKLSFIYIDCNLYQPSLKAMNDLFPLLSKNGILAIDEHLYGGETKAIKQFTESNDLELKHWSPTEGPSFYIIK